MQRIILRPIVKGDLESLNKWKNNEEVFKYLGGGFVPTSIDIQEKWMDSMMDLSGSNKRFIIEIKDSKKAIGTVGLYGINSIHRTAEVGLYIGELDEQGNGYAQEAYQLLEKYAKNYLNLRKLKLNVVYKNDKAVALWEKLGFKRCGNFEQERYIDGKYFDLLIMEKFL